MMRATNFISCSPGILLALLVSTSPAVIINNHLNSISVLLDARAEGAVPLFRHHNISYVFVERRPFQALLFLCQQLRTRTLPLVGSFTPRFVSYIRTFTSRYEVPYITWDDRSPPQAAEAEPPTAAPTSYSGPGGVLFPRYAPPRSRFKQKPGPPFVVSVRPDLTNALRGFLKLHKWSSFGYVYTCDFGFERYQEIIARSEESSKWEVRSAAVQGLEMLDPSGVRERAGPPERPNIGYFDPEERIYSRLKHLDWWLKKSEMRNVVLDVNGKENTLRLLRILQNLGMMRQEYHYLILDFGIRELPLSPYQFCGVNISGFQLLDYDNDAHVRFMHVWAKRTEQLRMELHEIALVHDALSIAKFVADQLPLGWSTHSTRVKCFERDMQRSRFMNYSHMRPWARGRQVKTQLKSLAFQGVTGTIQFDERFRRRNFSVDLIQYSGLVGNSVKIGTYHSGSSTTENVEHRHRVAPKEKLAPNATLRVVSILTKPFLQYKESVLKEAEQTNSPLPTRGKENFTGYCVELAREIFNHLPHYDYDIHLVEDKEYGSLENRTWNGMVGEVLSGKADIIIAPLTITSQRARYLYFSEPFMTFGLSIMLKKPEKTLPGTFSFMYPLSNTLWISITASCVSVGVALYVIARLSPFEWDAPEDLRFNLFNSMWFSLSAFVQQGVSFSPASPGARLLSSLWWMFSIVIMAYYTANLAAFLTVERLITPIKSVKDLVEKRQTMGIEYGMLRKGSTYEFFANSKDKLYTAIHDEVKKNNFWLVNSTKEGIERVRNSHGLYAFIMESKMNEYHYHRKPCDTIMGEETIGNKEYGVAVPREGEANRELWDKLNQVVLKLREGQTLATLYTDWWISRGNCADDSQKTGSRSLALVNVSGVFYILIVGLVLAMFWAITEAICAHSCRHHRRTRMNRHIS